MGRATLQKALPFAVSAVILAALFASIDTGEVARNLSAETLTALGFPLLAFGVLSLVIEAICLTRLVPAGSGDFDFWTAARIKAASYLLTLVHYAVGAGTLTLLLRRRTGMPIADAAGIVMLIVLCDLGMLIALTALGAMVIGTEEPLVQASVIGFASAGLVAGFLLLRAPGSLGPLERLRSLAVFHAARTTSLGRLAELAALRLLFVASFVWLVGAALAAFGVSVPTGDLILGVAAVALVAALPIAVSGLGTGQVAFVAVFGSWGDPGTLLACSLALSAGMIAMRAGMGVFFAREFTREALSAAREAEG